MDHIFEDFKKSTMPLCLIGKKILLVLQVNIPIENKKSVIFILAI
jgi:hypothetical protein